MVDGGADAAGRGLALARQVAASPRGPSRGVERVLLLLKMTWLEGTKGGAPGETAMATTSAQPTPGLAEADRDPQTTLGLLRQLLDELSLLFRQEVRLATAEVSRSLSSLVTGATSLAAAAAVLFAGLLVLLAAAVLGLSLALPAWLAALVVGAAAMLVGFALLGAGRAKFRATTVKPEHTVESLSKDKDVLTRRTT